MDRVYPPLNFESSLHLDEASLTETQGTYLFKFHINIIADVCAKPCLNLA